MPASIECIYCRQRRPESAYTKAEHVLPQSFGKFRNNLTLIRSVCDDCNQFFGDYLELPLARDTVEGQSRVDFEVKKPEEFRSPGPRTRLKVRIAEGPFKGAYAFRSYSKDVEGVQLKPVPQVGFRQMSTGDYSYFLLDDLPELAAIEDAQADLEHPEAIRAFGVSVDELSRRLAAKGIPFRNGGEIAPPEDEESLLCEIESTVDNTIKRAAAKIAFNYLAYWEGDGFVLRPQFNPIRDFVRWGLDAPYPLVAMSGDSVLADETDKRRLGHAVTLNWASDGVSIVAQLSLLAWFKYSVCLAREYDGERREISRGHFFNIADGEILKLGRR